MPGIQKYSKKGNGPYIKSLKYYNKKIGSHINITRDEFGNQCEETKNRKKVILLSLNPWRTDVYYNKELNQFELLGIKYNHLKFIKGEYGVLVEVYDTLKIIEKISPESEFCFSLHRKNRVLIEDGEEQLQGLFSSRTMNNANYFELKPIDKARWDKTEDVPLFGKVSNGQFIKRLRSNMKITKINTDHLGKCYYVKKETLKNIIS